MQFGRTFEGRKFKERAKILMYVIIQDWYDNREAGESKDFNYTIRSMMTQLQAGG